MVKERLILVGFFIFFATQNALLIGHFRFYTKGYEIATVQGNSMFPTLKNGQKAIINYNIPEGNLTNMIVVFGNTSICHRCTKDEGQWLTFKGDNTSSFEHATRDELKAIFIKATQDPFLDSVLLGLQ
jgi:signal peptidase I